MIAHYQAWLLKKPHDRLAMYGLALELKKAGRHDDAVAAFDALLLVHPTSGAGWFQYGQLLEHAGDEDGALDIWRQGVHALEGCDEPEAARSLAELQGAINALE